MRPPGTVDMRAAAEVPGGIAPGGGADEAGRGGGMPGPRLGTGVTGMGGAPRTATAGAGSDAGLADTLLIGGGIDTFEGKSPA